MGGMSDRTYAKFTFFKLDPEWQRRSAEERAQDKREFLAACEDFAQDRSLRAYSTVGTRGDTDLLVLSQSPILEDLHTFHVVLAQSGLARWATIPHSYLALTKRSPYSDAEARVEICTSDRRYLIVYPMDKKREWYTLPEEERGRIMADHIRVGPRRIPRSRSTPRTRSGSTTRSSWSPSRPTTPGCSSTWSRSSAGLSPAPTRCGTRRSSPASRCRSGRALDALDGVAQTAAATA